MKTCENCEKDTPIIYKIPLGKTDEDGCYIKYEIGDDECIVCPECYEKRDELGVTV